MKLKALLAVGMFSFWGITASAQFEEIDIYQTQIDPVSGIKVLSKDSSYSINMRFRLQNRFEAEADDVDQPYKWDRHVFLTRRFRLRSDGYVVDKTFRYAFQLSFTQGDQDFATTGLPNIVRDAMVFYKPNNKFEIGFGLTKLPGNRQRVISSGEQQFVDRSILNSMLNVDRDHGIFFRYKEEKVKIPFRLQLALSNGTGRNYDEKTAGFAATGKLELLPLGEFKYKGDYFDGDFVHEEKPKLSLAVAYSLNKDAVRTGGQIGKALYGESDINTLFADVLFKYRGWAFMGEFALRDASNPVTFDGVNPTPRFVYTGNANNIQLSYQSKKHHEVALRWARFTPNKDIEVYQAKLNDVTLAYTKYVRFHRVKVQADITYRNAHSNVVTTTDYWLYRFQIEMGI
ncbi:porin [bacterium]|nr:MAG: porin [bacterium]